MTWSWLAFAIGFITAHMVYLAIAARWWWMLTHSDRDQEAIQQDVDRIRRDISLVTRERAWRN